MTIKLEKEYLYLVLAILLLIIFFKEILLVVTIFTIIGLKSGLNVWFKSERNKND